MMEAPSMKYDSSTHRPHDRCRSPRTCSWRHNRRVHSHDLVGAKARSRTLHQICSRSSSSSGRRWRTVKPRECVDLVSKTCYKDMCIGTRGCPTIFTTLSTTSRLRELMKENSRSVEISPTSITIHVSHKPAALHCRRPSWRLLLTSVYTT